MNFSAITVQAFIVYFKPRVPSWMHKYLKFTESEFKCCCRFALVLLFLAFFSFLAVDVSCDLILQLAEESSWGCQLGSFLVFVLKRIAHKVIAVWHFAFHLFASFCPFPHCTICKCTVVCIWTLVEPDYKYQLVRRQQQGWHWTQPQSTVVLYYKSCTCQSHSDITLPRV